ncbi:hypothetical protein [Bradyrhizobium sp. STM 3557]|uniref:hypothetical protein n=1 Tax=Bradyrhizobium sp. STM 3557 TaxID=578920 RepID=UPI003890062C
MNIVSHGTWSLYVPSAWPEGFPSNIIFCKSDVSGADWYAFQQARSLSDESVKLLLRMDGSGRTIVQVATVDASRLFPAGSLLLEMYDAMDFTNPDGVDPQVLFGGMMYDAAANALVDAPAVTFVPESATKLGLRRVFVEQGRWDQVRALIASDSVTQEEWDLAIEIKRSDPLTQALISAMSLQPADVDAILVRAKQLTEF